MINLFGIPLSVTCHFHKHHCLLVFFEFFAIEFLSILCKLWPEAKRVVCSDNFDRLWRRPSLMCRLTWRRSIQWDATIRDDSYESRGYRSRGTYSIGLLIWIDAGFAPGSEVTEDFEGIPRAALVWIDPVFAWGEPSTLKHPFNPCPRKMA